MNKADHMDVPVGNKRVEENRISAVSNRKHHTKKEWHVGKLQGYVNFQHLREKSMHWFTTLLENDKEHSWNQNYSDEIRSSDC
ncbi:unnamed protein product [Orchesella dallaii]|uniref:Uncharacterized protein n=1 Tax=Orchesella dallaii TaxID=48710 RepID=A0ABP1QPW5_9HEXA